MSDRGPAVIGWLRADELPELQAYIDAHWQAGHILVRDAALARWQYRHPGDPGLLSVLGARDDEGALVGILGLIQTPFAWLGETLRGAWLAMWSVLPEARPGGPGLALLVEAMRSFDVVAAVGFTERVERIFRGFRFEVRPAVPRWVRSIDEGAFERLVARRPMGFPSAQTTASARSRAWGAEVGAKWDDCWHRLLPGFVGTARDAAFLRWRYAEHPTFDYAVQFAEGARGRVTALCVHRVERVRDSSETVIRIVELLGEPGPAAALVSRALAETPHAALADFFCTSPQFAEPLEMLGFVREDPLADPVPDRFQPLDRSRGLAGGFWRRDGGGEAFDGAPLYATRADGDQDRPS